MRTPLQSWDRIFPVLALIFNFRNQSAAKSPKIQLYKPFLFLFLLVFLSGTSQTTTAFSYTGANQTFVVPSGVTSINVKMWGAGGAGGYYGIGGTGAFVTGSLTVTPGQTLTIIVGQGGQIPTNDTSIYPYGGGGRGGFQNTYKGGGGGGRSALRLGTVEIVTSGGGGGGGGFRSTYLPSGGGGGATNGNDSNNTTGGNYSGKLGTLSVGGAAGNASNGTAPTSGSSLSGGNGGISSNSGGGGGGGYFGGGGGTGADDSNLNKIGGGGGGSSYITNASFSGTNTPGTAGSNNTGGTNAQVPGNTDPNYTGNVGNGGNYTPASGGDGRVVLTYTAAPCSSPTTQATIGSYTNNTSGTGLTVNWTRGNGNNVIVVGRLTATSLVNPTSGTSYTANSAFGTAGTTTGTGNFVVYNGSGTTVNVTGLTNNSNYTFTVYEYNTTGTCYKIPGSASAVTTTAVPPYLAQIISASTGSSSWCGGETRTVSVTIKNIGTAAWTDGGGNTFNIGVKWNKNDVNGSWTDYNVRTSAKNLAPGNTETYIFTIQASENIGGIYGNALPPVANNLTFDVVYEGQFWFGNNSNGGGPGNAVFTTGPQTINIAPKNYTLQETVSPVGATTCQDYIRLDILGMPDPFPFKELFTPRTSTWTKTVYGTAPNYVGIDITSSSSSQAGGDSGPTEARFFSLSDNYNTIGDWTFFPDTGTVNVYRPISLDGYSAAEIKFNSRFQSKGNGLTRNIYAEVSTDAVNWTSVWQVLSIGNNVDRVDVASFNLLGYLGSTIYIRFRYYGAGTGLLNWYLDDITISGTIPPVMWAPTTGLYKDAGLSVPYNGTSESTLYAAPENTAMSYNVSSSITSCTKTTPLTSSILRTKKVFTGLDTTSPTLWNVTNNWDLKTIPTAGKCVNIPNGKNVVVNVSTAVAKSVTVDSGGKITISPNQALTITDAIINNAGAANFVVESDANLKQINENITNTGNITVKRESPMRKNNYTYWSSPVSGQQLGAFSPLTAAFRFYQYDEPTNLFQPVSTSNNFIPGKAYAIMAPGNYTLGSLTTFQGKFVGVPTNGIKNTDTSNLEFPLSLSAGADQGYNMIGNPYPSNIDFDMLHTLNSANIYNTAYFWTNVDPNRPGSTYGNIGYGGNAYAIYNGTGGVSASGPKGATNGGPIPTQYIKIGQGFIVKAKTNGQKLIFNNSIRNATGSSTFFSKGAASEKDRFWLKLTTPVLNVNTILIGYIPGATNDFEWDYDAPLFSVASDSFYSILGEEKLGIQGRVYPLNTKDVVALGTKHFEVGTYTISLGDKEGIFAESQSVYLKDKQTGNVTNLSEGNYTFNANAEESLNRFEIIYEPQTVLVTNSTVKEGLTVYRDGENYIIQSPKLISSVEVYDPSGKLIKVLKAASKKEIVEGNNLINGMYVLKIKTADGAIVTAKILK